MNSFVKSLPPLATLRPFEAAARLESFSRAADELHLTQAAISRQIRALGSATLGCRIAEVSMIVDCVWNIGQVEEASCWPALHSSHCSGGHGLAKSWLIQAWPSNRCFDWGGSRSNNSRSSNIGVRDSLSDNDGLCASSR